jgi:hypothetical protein
VTCEHERVLNELAAAELELAKRARVWLSALPSGVPLPPSDLEILRLFHPQPEPKEGQ